jgi:hypothetical protein
MTDDDSIDSDNTPPAVSGVFWKENILGFVFSTTAINTCGNGSILLHTPDNKYQQERTCTLLYPNVSSTATIRLARSCL